MRTGSRSVVANVSGLSEKPAGFVWNFNPNHGEHGQFASADEMTMPGGSGEDRLMGSDSMEENPHEPAIGKAIKEYVDAQVSGALHDIPATAHGIIKTAHEESQSLPEKHIVRIAAKHADAIVTKVWEKGVISKASSTLKALADYADKAGAKLGIPKGITRVVGMTLAAAGGYAGHHVPEMIATHYFKMEVPHDALGMMIGGGMEAVGGVGGAAAVRLAYVASLHGAGAIKEAITSSTVLHQAADLVKSTAATVAPAAYKVGKQMYSLGRAEGSLAAQRIGGVRNAAVDPQQQQVDMMLGAIKDYQCNPWYLAILVESIIHRKDVANGIALADQVFTANPKPD